MYLHIPKCLRVRKSLNEFLMCNLSRIGCLLYSKKLKNWSHKCLITTTLRVG